MLSGLNSVFLCSPWYVPYVLVWREISVLFPGFGDLCRSPPFLIIMYKLIWSSMSALIWLFVRRQGGQIGLLMMMCWIWSSRFLEFLHWFQYWLYMNNFYLIIIVLLDSFYKEVVTDKRWQQTSRCGAVCSGYNTQRWSCLFGQKWSRRLLFGLLGAPQVQHRTHLACWIRYRILFGPRNMFWWCAKLSSFDLQGNIGVALALE